jgi:hypothetical protein
MPGLSRTARVATIDQVLSKFAGRQDGEPWDLVRVNNVMEGFGLDTVYVDFEGDYLNNARVELQEADNDTLVEVHSFVISGTSVVGSPEDGPDEGSDLWTPGQVRLFLSHAAIHKGFVGEVAEHLGLSGIHGFVAHDSIEPTREWQAEIERALRTAHLFVGLVHREFLPSAWTNQEVGWAKGRDIPFFMIRFGADPSGFPGSVQWPSMQTENAGSVAGRIQQWINTLPQYSDTIGGRLLAALENARSYQAAGGAGDALKEFDALSPEQWTELDRIFLANDQVCGGALARRALKPLYDRHGRTFPERG